MGWRLWFLTGCCLTSPHSSFPHDPLWRSACDIRAVFPHSKGERCSVQVWSHGDLLLVFNSLIFKEVRAMHEGFPTFTVYATSFSRRVLWCWRLPCICNWGRVSPVLGWPQTHYTATDDLELGLFVSDFWVLASQVYTTTHLMYVVLDLLRNLCMLGRHSTNYAISTIPKLVSSNLFVGFCFCNLLLAMTSNIFAVFYQLEARL